MPELLYEIGCEELPAVFVAPALAQMQLLFRDKFTAAKLFSDSPVGCSCSSIGGGGAIQTYGTPRRLVLHAVGLMARQSDETVLVKGPSASVAFDADGKPTRAALGFAQKNGISAEELTVVDGYVQATVTRAGRSTGEIAAELLPQIARELTFPKAMRWGANKLRFARPIRWIVALLDEAVIPFSIEHVPSGRTTRGHRFLSPHEVDVPDAAAYFPLIRQKSVLIDPEERRNIILSQATKLAEEANGQVQIAEELLEENVFLTEYPTAVLGNFDSDYLNLPRPVLVTAMRKHQRYFPVLGADGVLMPTFVAIRNGGDQYLDTVRAGFENVLAARFNDARFFHDLDTQTSLAAKVDGTQTILFQEKLGSVYQKSLRLGQILLESGLLEGSNEAETSQVLRAAELCKADLASEMVKELTSLQGIMGEEYARRDGEGEEVARAIAEHYMPKGAGDPLPASDAGRLLAIADRVDTLTGYLGLGIVPSGTSDPFALRRAASGLVALLATAETLPPVHQLFYAAWNAYLAQEIPLTADKDTAYDVLLLLLTQRLDAALEEKGIRYDLREAILAAPLETIFETESRAVAVSSLRDSADFAAALAAATRIGRIVRFASKEGFQIPPGDPKQALFDHPAETALWEQWTSAAPAFDQHLASRDYASALVILSELRPSVDAFFDAVMVMDDDPTKRDNNLALLARLHQAYTRLADFEKVVTA